jgi:shikimate kinase
MTDDARTILEQLDRPIVMLGLMGAGKTKIGSLLAQALGLPFVDADHEIERAAGMSVADIFETHGEPAFRDLERKVIARLLSDEIKVIAPGGGAIMNPETAELVFGKALTVWLKADLDILLERTARNDKRPLLKAGNPEDILKSLMEKRYPVYGRAEVHLQTDASEPDVAAGRLLSMMAAYLKEKR